MPFKELKEGKTSSCDHLNTNPNGACDNCLGVNQESFADRLVMEALEEFDEDFFEHEGVWHKRGADSNCERFLKCHAKLFIETHIRKAVNEAKREGFIEERRIFDPMFPK